MRRTGRTSRIVDHAVDRLLSDGLVYVHDHTDYPHTINSAADVARLIQKRVEPFLDKHRTLRTDFIPDHRYHRGRSRKVVLIKLEILINEDNEQN